MQNLFNKDYFEKGIELGISGYSNYRWIPELTFPMAHWLIKYLGIKEDDRILDFGCAKGYLVLAFRLLHYKMYGCDVSDYALKNAPNEIQDYISRFITDFDKFDWVISKDVFEHIPYSDIDYVLCTIRKMCNNMFCIIPLGENGKYNIELYEHDKTHIIRESMEWWHNKFEDVGFIIREQVYRKKHIKENYARYKKGNGFFTLTSRL